MVYMDISWKSLVNVLGVSSSCMDNAWISMYFVYLNTYYYIQQIADNMIIIICDHLDVFK